MKGKRVLVFEPKVSGHHGPYLEWMVQGLIGHGFTVTLVTLPESLMHPSMREIVQATETTSGQLLQVIQSIAVAPQRRRKDGIVSLLMRELTYWRQFRGWYKAHVNTIHPDVVLLPYLDYCLYAIGLLGSPFGGCPWVGVSMRPSFHYQEMGVIAPKPSLAAIKKWLFLRVLNNKHLRCLLTIDEPLSEYLAKVNKFVGRYAFLPEPVGLGYLPDVEDAKRFLRVPQKRKLILVYGAITYRKGVVELLRAVADPSFPPLIDVLLAGKIASELDGLLAEPWVAALVSGGRLRILDRFFESNEEPHLFSAADIVWLGYKNHYTASGVLVQAARAGRPVLACAAGIIGWQTSRYSLGEVIEPKEIKSVMSGVYALLQHAEAVPVEGRHRQRVAIGGTFSDAKAILVKAVAGQIETFEDVDNGGA